MKLDDILLEIGEFGRYQKWIFFLTCLTSLHCGIFVLISVFLLGEPNHRCALQGYDNDTYEIQSYSHRVLVNRTIPTSSDDAVLYDRCHVISGAASYDTNNQPINGTLTKCNSWVYDKSVFKATYLSETDLVCGSAIEASNAKMLFYAGMLVGSLMTGIAADRYGRKVTMNISLIVMLASSVGISFAKSYTVFVILFFILGGSLLGYFLPAYIIGLEIVGPSKRIWAGLTGNFFYIVGYLLVGGVAYAIRDWKYVELALSCPAALFLTFWCLVPESPRWLISQGRLDEATVILKKIARSNKTTLSPTMLHGVTEESDKGQGKFWLLFTNRTMCIRTLINFFDWFTVSLAYFGLSLNVGTFHNNFYLDYTLYGMVEVPAYVLCFVLLDRVGRKKLYLFTITLGGIACLATIFTTIYQPAGSYNVSFILATVGKFGVTIAFCVIYVFSAELFPTVVRNAGIGGCSLSARTAGMFAPYLVNLGNLLGGGLGKVFTLVIIGLVCLVSAVLTIFLPETLNRQLPETMQDAVLLDKDRDYKSTGRGRSAVRKLLQKSVSHDITMTTSF